MKNEEGRMKNNRGPEGFRYLILKVQSSKFKEHRASTGPGICCGGARTDTRPPSCVKKQGRSSCSESNSDEVCTIQSRLSGHQEGFPGWSAKSKKSNKKTEDFKMYVFRWVVPHSFYSLSSRALVPLRYNNFMKKISFVILTWNSEKVISACLESLQTIKDQNIEIILIDNGSTDGTVKIINTFTNTNPEINLSLIQLEKNYGTTVSRNLGIQKISDGTDYVCILDSDTVINQDAVSELIKELESDEKNGIAGPQMVNLEGIEQVTAKCIPTAALKFCKAFPLRAVQKIGEEKERYDFSEKRGSYPVGYLISACWMIKRKVIDKLGPLDEKIFYSPEDVEYCVRAWKMGYRVIFCPDAHIIHATQRISKKKLFSRHNWEHLKGLIYFFKKYDLFFSSKKIICK